MVRSGALNSMVRPRIHPSTESLFEHLSQEKPLAQPLLLHGPNAPLLATAARWLAAGWLCAASTGRPCGTCSGCRDVQRGMGDRFHAFDASTDGGVSDLGRIQERASTRASSHQVLLLERADRATLPALQRLLKLLEEVTGSTTFLLTATSTLVLPETLRSRCLHLNVPPLPERAGPLPEGARSTLERLLGPLGNALIEPSTPPSSHEVSIALRALLGSYYGLERHVSAPKPNFVGAGPAADAATTWVRDTVAGRFSPRSAFERLSVSLHPCDAP